MNAYPFYPSRKILVLDGAWDFNFIGDAELEQLDPAEFTFHDVMCVPGAFDCSPAYYCKRGIALYRTDFTLEQNAPDALLKLGGLGLRARFWIDGREIGFTNLPYSGAEFKTGKLTAGKHTLCAALDNRFDPEKMKLFLPYYDFYAFGGFYRGVTLHLLPEGCCIDRVQIRTTDYRTGKVNLRFLFRGDVPETLAVQLKFDTENAFRSETLTIQAHSASLELAVPDFKLWSTETPDLHTLEVRTENDHIVESFGIREVKAERKQILLNGKPVFLKGFNRHESHPEFGPATPEQVMIEDLQNLKALNCNFIRGCHYPQDQRFLDLCDRMGFLVWEESLGWGNTKEQMADPEFIALQEKQTRLMVRNSVNHPSVIIWAFLNEFESGTQEGQTLCRKLVAAIRKEDDSRLVTFACSHVWNDICTALTDIVAYNTYPGWISADAAEEPPSYIRGNRDKIIERFRTYNPPDKPVMVSEMGCCGLYGSHDRAAAQWSEEFQAEYLAEVIRQVFASPDLCGLAIWQFNDAKSYLRKGSNIRCKPLAQNLAGVFDQYRRPKLAAETVKKLFAEKK